MSCFVVEWVLGSRARWGGFIRHIEDKADSGGLCVRMSKEIQGGCQRDLQRFVLGR